MRLVNVAQRLIRVLAEKQRRTDIVLNNTSGRLLDLLVAHLGMSSMHPGSGPHAMRGWYSTNECFCELGNCLSASPRPAFAFQRACLSTLRTGL